MDIPYSPRKNALIGALPMEEWLRLISHLEPVVMQLGDVLYEPDQVLRYAYFPVNSIVSLLYVMTNGASAEIAVIGNEGMVGTPIILGSQHSSCRAVIQSAGYGFRIKANLLRQEFKTRPTIASLLLRYTQALITQITQTAVCNRHCVLEKQLCRWLLLSLDRLECSELIMTQELIANMLGVRREGVTEAAGKLQKEGLISYSRGHIEILDRTGLELKSCECYQVVRKEYEQLFPPRAF
ncbi:Crp/Fnr family transcriptional regulator [Methylobacillus gramineus]|uniref:Crp/Fnr family transcriptional regulator n=1 Tax=Methylobacillus gramineus TaxID=755169 RepID=UPI001CFFFC6A|nr:Crp/Fnr family transcriptional regulator [Methylobacillus gramineus]MCB5184647.1 Crp/Fnr family transcriptional regulator [Methylobacillus gramineus]